MSIYTYLVYPDEHIICPVEWEISCWNPLPGGGVEHIDIWPGQDGAKFPYLCYGEEIPVRNWEHLYDFYDGFEGQVRMVLTYNSNEPLAGPVCFLSGADDYFYNYFPRIPIAVKENF